MPANPQSASTTTSERNCEVVIIRAASFTVVDESQLTTPGCIASFTKICSAINSFLITNYELPITRI